MRECPVCGASNGETDDFCGNCGSYLGWSDEANRSARTEPDVASPDATTQRPDAAEAPGAGVDAEAGPGATAVSGSGHPSAPPDTNTDPGTGSGSGSGDGAGPGTGTTPPPTPPTPPQTPAPRAQVQARPPQPVKPAKAVAPRPVVRAVGAEEDASGAPCPVCGTPNPPGRRFCRRCASPLTPTTAAPSLPWWRTMWPLRRRTRAGSGRLTRTLVILGVVLALCVGGFFLLPAGRRLIEDTRDKLGKAEAVSPSGVTATAQLPGHPATDTLDGLSNRYWAAPAPGASLTYTFGRPFRLVDLIITNGASKSAEKYAAQARALKVDAEVTTEGGEVQRREITLSDKPGSQPVQFGISDVEKIRLTLSSPVGLTRGRHIALAEVEFFQRT